MRLIALAIAASLSSCIATAVYSQEYRITDDVGGKISDYVTRYVYLGNTGTPVVIDGRCLSACTLFFGIIPQERVCATRRAVLGFHMAWDRGPSGNMVPNQSATEILLNGYPQSLRRWLKQHGRLGLEIRYMRSPTVFSFVRQCPGGMTGTVARYE